MVRKLTKNKVLGLQHGFGLYYLNKEDVKVGEWSEGKRIKWLNE